jgi:hypothetical protein
VTIRPGATMEEPMVIIDSSEEKDKSRIGEKK